MSRSDVEEGRVVDEEKENVNERNESRDEMQPDTSSVYKGLTPEQMEHVGLVRYG